MRGVSSGLLREFSDPSEIRSHLNVQKQQSSGLGKPVWEHCEEMDALDVWQSHIQVYSRAMDKGYDVFQHLYESIIRWLTCLFTIQDG